MASPQPSTSTSHVKPATGRKFTKIPVFVVENHNDVLELLLPSLANRYLPFTGNLMIHFDSHPDCCVPREMPATTIYERQTLLESLSIENWIVPMMYAQHLKEVCWVRPPWARQIADGHHKFQVGDSDGKIYVSSTLEYFLCDGSYKDENVMINKKEVTLHVSLVSDSINELLSDDVTWILDIDLDYFSTYNPFLSLFPKAGTYEKLRKIYFEKKNEEEEPSDYVAVRNRQLDFYETIFQHMAQHGSLENFKCDASMKEKFEPVKELIDCLCHHYSIYDIDWFIVHGAGCTCDDEEHELPHHESTDEEIRTMVGELEKMLKGLKKPPTLVTIARSTIDGYTPAHQIEMIQSKVIEALRSVYGDSLAPETLWYKNKSEAISAMELVQPRKVKEVT